MNVNALQKSENHDLVSKSSTLSIAVVQMLSV